MSEPRDWPIEQPPGLRPWFFSAMGYLAILFRTRAEAQRAQQGLHARGVPEEDVRLYTSEQILDTEARLDAERSGLARAVAALTIDQEARRRYLDNAAAGGVALWLFAPTDHDANRLIQHLADYDYLSLRYYGEEGVAEIPGGPG